MRGQRFEVDLQADDLAEYLSADHYVQSSDTDLATPSSSHDPVKAIQEHEVDEIPPPPKAKQSRGGFPAHRPPRLVSAFKQQQLDKQKPLAKSDTGYEPSDQAILHQFGRKCGYSPEAKQKQDISRENEQRLAQMSVEDIEEARAELMRSLNPSLIEKLMKRANIEEDPNDSTAARQADPNIHIDPISDTQDNATEISVRDGDKLQESSPLDQSIHFPVAPRALSEYKDLDPDSPSFLNELKGHYFPDTPHDPSSLAWLQDPSVEENQESPYNPDRTGYNASDLRFGFNGRLIAPRESLDIDVSKGLHHHGEAPNSAGYTIPELTILSRSVLPNQRCLAYQLTGRILYRLGRGDFGPRGGELHEALWSTIERERILECALSEANRSAGHVSARAYAVEAVWLWRKGGGGDRGVLKPNERKAV